MIGRDELNAAFAKVSEYEKNGPPWHVNMEENFGIDPNAVLEMSAEHGDFMRGFGAGDANTHMISFGAGFTLAVIALKMEEGNND